MSVDDGVPSDDVRLGDIVERLPSGSHAATHRVHADKRGPDEEMGIEAVTDGMRMNLPTEDEGLGVCGRLEKEGEGEAVGRDGLPAHPGVEEEGVVRRLVGVGDAADEGVVHEGVGRRDDREEATGIVQSVGEDSGGEE